jgi:transcriptional regulator with XRE-family HTH domain
MGHVKVLVALGKKIKILRSDKKMTQNDLATECGFEKTSLSRIEAGQSNLTVKTLNKICRALGVPISEIFKE